MEPGGKDVESVLGTVGPGPGGDTDGGFGTGGEGGIGDGGRDG